MCKVTQNATDMSLSKVNVSFLLDPLDHLTLGAASWGSVPKPFLDQWQPGTGVGEAPALVGEQASMATACQVQAHWAAAALDIQVLHIWTAMCPVLEVSAGGNLCLRPHRLVSLRRPSPSSHPRRRLTAWGTRASTARTD